MWSLTLGINLLHSFAFLGVKTFTLFVCNTSFFARTFATPILMFLSLSKSDPCALLSPLTSLVCIRRECSRS